MIRVSTTNRRVLRRCDLFPTIKPSKTLGFELLPQIFIDIQLNNYLTVWNQSIKSDILKKTSD